MAIDIVRAHFSAPATSRKEKIHAESNQGGFPVSDAESQYDAYLLTRGLSCSTRNLHHHVVHKLLSARFPSGNIDWSRVRFNDFVQFLTSEFARLHNRATQTAWLMILRSFVRYLSHDGHVPPGWDAALPSIATRKHISLPRGLSPEQVRALWSASEGRRPRNLRDRALLLVFLRLGLRAEEVANIALADIDWRSGCLKIRSAKTYDVRVPSLFRKTWDRPWLRTWTFRADTRRTCLDRGALRPLNNVGALT